MFVTIIAQQVCNEKHNAKDNWYVLTATVVPFAPMPGLRLFIPPKGIYSIATTLWDTAQGVFHCMTPPHDVATPFATEVAAKTLVKSGNWMVAAAEADVQEAEQQLAADTIKQLQQKIIQAQRIQGMGPKIDPRIVNAVKGMNPHGRH